MFQHNPSGTWVNLNGVAPAGVYDLTYYAPADTTKISGVDVDGYTVLTMAGGTPAAPSAR